MGRFIEHLLRIGPQAVANGIPGFEAKTLEHIRSSVVILGDNVSNYFYEGNEQEDWSLEKDFPNVAPPFDLFFLDFKAPASVKSSVTGHNPWVKGMPIAWGLLCQSREQGEPPVDLRQESQRVSLRVSFQQRLGEHQQACAQFGYAEGTVPDHEIAQRFTGKQQEAIRHLKRIRAGHELVQKNNWEELEHLFYRHTGYHPGAKWVLELSLFVEHDWSRRKKGRVAIIPAWTWQIGVNAQGVIVGSKDMLNGPLAEEYFLQQAEPGVDVVETIEQYSGGYYQFLCTGLLTLSFLHCKNVELKTVEESEVSEESRSPHRKAAKKARQRQTAVRDQRPVQERPIITYHVLDVEPMKQVLRAEGQADQQGLKRAMHICRGHFAHYEQGKGLFGKYHGTYWREQHIRGSAERGVSIKDYRIKDVPETL